MKTLNLPETPRKGGGGLELSVTEVECRLTSPPWGEGTQKPSLKGPEGLGCRGIWRRESLVTASSSRASKQ